MPITLDQLNAATEAEAAQLLDGLYEHSPWIAQAALAQRPFRSLSHLKQAMAGVVRQASRDQQLALISSSGWRALPSGTIQRISTPSRP